MTKIDKPKCHSLIITGKVQDIGFRSIVEHIGRSFGMPGVVFNAKDGSVKILCSGEDSVIDNFTQTIKIRGAESGAEIIDIIESVNIELPDDFSKISSDDDIDIGRKLDKGNEFLKTLPEMNEKLNTLPEMNEKLNTLPEMNEKLNTLPEMNEKLNTLPEMNEKLDTLSEMRDMLGSSIIEQRGHNTRLEAILDKLADKAG